MRIGTIMYTIKNYCKREMYVLDGNGTIYELEPDPNVLVGNIVMGGAYPFENQIVITTNIVRKDGLANQEKYIRIDCPQFYDPSINGGWLEEYPNLNLVFSDRESKLREYREKYGTLSIRHGTSGCGTISNNGIQYGILNCTDSAIYVVDIFGVMRIEPGEDHLKEYDNLYYKKYEKPKGYIKVFRSYGLTMNDDRTEATFKINTDIYDVSATNLEGGFLIDYLNAIIFATEKDATEFINKYESIESYRRAFVKSELENVIHKTIGELEKNTNKKIKTALFISTLISAIGASSFLGGIIFKNKRDKNKEIFSSLSFKNFANTFISFNSFK